MANMTHVHWLGVAVLLLLCAAWMGEAWSPVRHNRVRRRLHRVERQVYVNPNPSGTPESPTSPATAAPWDDWDTWYQLQTWSRWTLRTPRTAVPLPLSTIHETSWTSRSWWQWAEWDKWQFEWQQWNSWQESWQAWNKRQDDEWEKWEKQHDNKSGTGLAVGLGGALPSIVITIILCVACFTSKNRRLQRATGTPMRMANPHVVQHPPAGSQQANIYTVPVQPPAYANVAASTAGQDPPPYSLAVDVDNYQTTAFGGRENPPPYNTAMLNCDPVYQLAGDIGQQESGQGGEIRELETEGRLAGEVVHVGETGEEPGAPDNGSGHCMVPEDGLADAGGVSGGFRGKCQQDEL